MKTETTAKIIIVLSLIGLVDAAYSTYEHYEIISGAIGKSFCDLGVGISCSAVNGSSFSEVFGIPMALIGVFWFAVLIILSHMMLRGSKNMEFFVFVWSVTGLGTVFWLLYAEYVIGAICLLCTLVHIIVMVNLVLAYKSLKKPILKYLEDTFYR